MKIEINCGNILRNAEKISAFTPLIAVVKADAYGHGGRRRGKDSRAHGRMHCSSDGKRGKDIARRGDKKRRHSAPPVLCARIIRAEYRIFARPRRRRAAFSRQTHGDQAEHRNEQIRSGPKMTRATSYRRRASKLTFIRYIRICATRRTTKRRSGNMKTSHI